MNKDAQQTAGLAGRTVQDLYSAVMMDSGLSYTERMQLINDIDRMLGSSPPSTPLQAIIWKLSGAGVGYLIAKYFNMSPAGKVIMSVTGLGLGTLMNNKLNPRPAGSIMFPR
jgi:hypothetical protein